MTRPLVQDFKAHSFRIELLNDAHDRTGFRCAEEALNRYLQTQASQDMRRRVANCFVAIESATGQVAAFCTLSAASIPFVDLPPADAKRLPRYPTLPAVRIGRLAVDERFQGQCAFNSCASGLGAALLMNAIGRATKADAAAFTLLVDAKNDRAAAFYRRYGFRSLISLPLTLFLPLSTALRSFHEK